jgi:hypothetical protein
MLEPTLRFWSTVVLLSLVGCSSNAPAGVEQPSQSAGASAAGGSAVGVLAGGAASTVAGVNGGSGVGTGSVGASTLGGGRRTAPAGASGTSGMPDTDMPAAGSGTPAESGACDVGTSETQWATGCKTSRPACMPGTWTAPGSTTNDPLGYESEHFAFYWPSANDYRANAQAAADVLEKTIWPAFLGAPVLFPEPYCNTDKKFKVSIVLHSDYGLTGGGWGAGYMGMWIGPGATSDHWGLAHEFTHALQASTGGLASSQYTGWIWESHANWHAHQLPDFHKSNVHCSEMLPNFPHLYLGSTRDRYCNWQFLEYLKDKYCYSAVSDVWEKSPKSGDAQRDADPFSVIQTNLGWTASQLNDFFGEWALHNVTWDYKDPDGSDQGALYRKSYGPITDVGGGMPAGFRRLRLTRLEPLDLAAKRFATPAAWAPQRWGYNVVRLFVEAGASSVRVKFRGVLQPAAANTNFGNYANQPATIPEPGSDWRWALVATDASGSRPRYSALQHGSDGEVSFCVGEGDAQLYLVVMATPQTVQKIQWDQMYYTLYRYPWMIELSGASPSGYQADAPPPAAGAQRWENGGGWVASGATVSASAYVGPFAQVLGGTVSDNARVEEHAVILNGAIGGDSVVKGLSVIAGGLNVSGKAVVATVFQAPGTFERGQKISGTGQIVGDVELRGTNIDISKGVFYGMVDATAVDATSPSQGADRTAPVVEVTAPAPYVWR